MNKFVLLFALVASVVAEPPSNYGAPQEYSAPVYTYSSSSSGYDGGDDGSQYVDDALLARIAQILEQSESRSSGGGYSAPSSDYGPPSSDYGPPSSGYGAPARSSGGGILLGRPERAQRVAEFDLTEQRSSGYSGGYN